jgi:hypothetical protein
MLYNIEERDGSAFLKCRQCPYEESITAENPIVYDHDLMQDTSIQFSINPYLKHDPTLPRFTNMKWFLNKYFPIKSLGRMGRASGDVRQERAKANAKRL